MGYCPDRLYHYLYHGVRLRQRVHTVTISRSAVIHAERLPIEPRPTAHTMGYRDNSRVDRQGHNRVREPGAGVFHMATISLIKRNHIRRSVSDIKPWVSEY